MSLKQKDKTKQLTACKIQEIPASQQDQRDWTVAVNGVQVEPLNHATFENSKIGIKLEYGKRAEGYDGIVIREPAGAAVVPYMLHPETGVIYVGVVSEYRPTIGEGFTDNIPRGFSKLNHVEKESTEITAQRELHEESGFNTKFRIGDKRMILLAEGLNPNSSYFDFSKNASDGVSIYAVRVELSELESKQFDDNSAYYVFPEKIQGQMELDEDGEHVVGTKFIPLENAIKSRDMFTSAGIGHLILYLTSHGEYTLNQN